MIPLWCVAPFSMKDLLPNAAKLKRIAISLWENAHLNACLVYMLYCLANQKYFNLAYYMAKRMASMIKSDLMVIPCAMLLTCLYRHGLTMEPRPTINTHYLVDHVMAPLIEGRAHRFVVDGKRSHPQTSSGSSSSQSLTRTQGEVDPVDNFTLEPVDAVVVGLLHEVLQLPRQST
ncbi:hypothetical protein Tco_0729650 [Tanacetum coccineum]|uniref:Uncharacterized protein n=1 Tax=Tanacetum coccineum TaxID=301880 RepID=A0ABQ4YPF7_9ASTR